MDPFSKLPAEIGAEIFSHMHSLESVIHTYRASPSMLRQFLQSKPHILWPILRKELAGDLFHDAIAIITFPTQASDVKKHLETWVTRRFPDRLVDYGASGAADLCSLYLRLRGYINDYLLKATCKEPRLAYLQLPCWTHPSYSSKSADATIATGLSEKRVSMSSISVIERHRFLRAFMNFELICKIHRPRPLPHFEVDDLTALLRGDCFGNYEGWNRSTPDQDRWLQDLRTQKMRDPILLPILGVDINPLRNPWEEEMTLCVQEYLITLWKALSVRHIEPSDYLILPHHENASEILFSEIPFTLENVQGYDQSHSHTFNALAAFGFDLLDNLMKSPKSDLFSTVAQFREEYRYRHPDVLPCILVNPVADPPSAILSRQHIRPNHDCGPNPSKLWNLWASYVMYAQYNMRGRRGTCCPLRQRAWPFFDNSKYYPPEWLSTNRSNFSCGLFDRFPFNDLAPAPPSPEADLLASWVTQMAETSNPSGLGFLKEDFRTGKWDYYPSLSKWLTPSWRRR